MVVPDEDVFDFLAELQYFSCLISFYLKSFFSFFQKQETGVKLKSSNTSKKSLNGLETTTYMKRIGRKHEWMNFKKHLLFLPNKKSFAFPYGF